ncbi:Z385A protein, partial [Atractosteus spatula]|nr:Z385A protein [Atractosteus spatula]
MDPVQKAVINHTFGVPLVKTKRPVISCNVCQIRFNSESQAEAHYKGNRHARRVKGIETSKSRPQEPDKPTPPPTTSPSPPGPPPASPAENDTSRAEESPPHVSVTVPTPVHTGESSPCLCHGPYTSAHRTHGGAEDLQELLSVFHVRVVSTSDAQPLPQLNGPSPPPPILPVTTPLQEPLAPPMCSLLPAPTGGGTSSLAPPPASGACPPGRRTPRPPDTPGLSNGVPPQPAPTAPSASPTESEEDKAKKLLYCSLCKVAVNSLSQLEAHNKGFGLVLECFIAVVLAETPPVYLPHGVLIVSRDLFITMKSTAEHERLLVPDGVCDPALPYIRRVEDRPSPADPLHKNTDEKDKGEAMEEEELEREGESACTKHKTILEARSGLGPIKAYPRLGPKPSVEQGGAPQDPNTQERTFHCEICNVRVNSELQLKQHISSRRHRDGVAGKPNPLLGRHKKHRTGDLASTLPFHKDLPKALGAGLLPSPLAVAAAMAAAASSNPLALRAAAGPAHHHPHHHLLQGPPLGHALLRPAPGPIRTSHGPILFSPY